MLTLERRGFDTEPNGHQFFGPDPLVKKLSRNETPTQRQRRPDRGAKAPLPSPMFIRFQSNAAYGTRDQLHRRLPNRMRRNPPATVQHQLLDGLLCQRIAQ